MASKSIVSLKLNDKAIAFYGSNHREATRTKDNIELIREIRNRQEWKSKVADVEIHGT